MCNKRSAVAFTVVLVLILVCYFNVSPEHSFPTSSVQAKPVKVDYGRPNVSSDKAQKQADSKKVKNDLAAYARPHVVNPSLTTSPSTRLMESGDLEILANSGYTCFDNFGNINPNIYQQFSFTQNEEKNFPIVWQHIFNMLTAIEAHNISNIKEQQLSSSFTIGPYPQTGRDFLKIIQQKVSGEVPPSFIDYFTNYSQNDVDFLLYNIGQSRKQVTIEKRNLGEYQITESVELLNQTTKQWEAVNFRDFSFDSIPERYKRILEK